MTPGEGKSIDSDTKISNETVVENAVKEKQKEREKTYGFTRNQIEKVKEGNFINEPLEVEAPKIMSIAKACGVNLITEPNKNAEKIKAYQKIQGLTETGSIGPLTYANMKAQVLLVNNNGNNFIKLLTLENKKEIIDILKKSKGKAEGLSITGLIKEVKKLDKENQGKTEHLDFFNEFNRYIPGKKEDSEKYMDTAFKNKSLYEMAKEGDIKGLLTNNGVILARLLGFVIFGDRIVESPWLRAGLGLGALVAGNAIDEWAGLSKIIKDATALWDKSKIADKAEKVVDRTVKGTSAAYDTASNAVLNTGDTILKTMNSYSSDKQERIKNIQEGIVDKNEKNKPTAGKETKSKYIKPEKIAVLNQLLITNEFQKTNFDALDGLSLNKDTYKTIGNIGTIEEGDFTNYKNLLKDIKKEKSSTCENIGCLFMAEETTVADDISNSVDGEYTDNKPLNEKIRILIIGIKNEIVRDKISRFKGTGGIDDDKLASMNAYITENSNSIEKNDLGQIKQIYTLLSGQNIVNKEIKKIDDIIIKEDNNTSKENKDSLVNKLNTLKQIKTNFDSNTNTINQTSKDFFGERYYTKGIEILTKLALSDTNYNTELTTFNDELNKLKGKATEFEKEKTEEKAKNEKAEKISKISFNNIEKSDDNILLPLEVLAYVKDKKDDINFINECMNDEDEGIRTLASYKKLELLEILKPFDTMFEGYKKRVDNINNEMDKRMGIVKDPVLDKNSSFKYIDRYFTLLIQGNKIKETIKHSLLDLNDANRKNYFEQVEEIVGRKVDGVIIDKKIDISKIYKMRDKIIIASKNKKIDIYINLDKTLKEFERITDIALKGRILKIFNKDNTIDQVITGLKKEKTGGTISKEDLVIIDKYLYILQYYNFGDGKDGGISKEEYLQIDNMYKTSKVQDTNT